MVWTPVCPTPRRRPGLQPCNPPRGPGAQKADGPRGRVRLTRRPTRAASRGRPGSPSPRRSQACSPQRPCASHVPTPRTPAASPTYCLKPSPTSRLRPTFETTIRAPNGRSHAGAGRSPAAGSVGHLRNARTTFPRMPRGRAGPPRGTLWAMWFFCPQSSGVSRWEGGGVPVCSRVRGSTGSLGQTAMHSFTI